MTTDNNKAIKPMNAYLVRWDGYACIEFAPSSVVARRKGSIELGIEFENVESCRRAYEFDKFSPGPVPQRVLFDSGWHLECAECSMVVNAYSDDCVWDGDEVYCSDAHRAKPEGEGMFFKKIKEITP